MKASRSFHFTLNSEEDFFWTKQSVTVVALVGKSSCRYPSEKQILFDQLTGRWVRFADEHVTSDSQPPNDCNDIQIQGFFDGTNQVVYLHLISELDASRLVDNYYDASFTEPHDENAEHDATADGFLAHWSARQFNFARALLFIFSVSHIVVWHHPTAAVLDVGVLRLLQSIGVCRHKLQSFLSEWLSSVAGLSEEWAVAGRFCTPRLLLAFSRCPSQLATASGDVAPLVRQLQRSLERQIYRLMRRCRLLSPGSSSGSGGASAKQPLFSLPGNQPFVWLSASSEPSAADLCHTDLQLLHRLCLSANPVANVVDLVDNESVLTLADLVDQHVESAIGRGFDDTLGKHVQPPFFCCPAGRVWFSAARLLYKRLLLVDLGSAHHQKFSTVGRISDNASYLKVLLNFQSALGADLRFSESRCARALPLAVAVYQESLPARYPRNTHASKLVLAVNVFRMAAPGPWCRSYTRRLERECDAVWKSGGRQMCERLSLTGNPCINPVHRLLSGTQQGMLDDSSGAVTRTHPAMEHCSGVRYLATCNCGRTQVQKSDPFTVRYANHDFYEDVGKQCCGHMPHISLPVFYTSTEVGSQDSEEGGDSVTEESWGKYATSELAGVAPDTSSAVSLPYVLGLSQDDASFIESSVVDNNANENVETGDLGVEVLSEISANVQRSIDCLSSSTSKVDVARVVISDNEPATAVVENEASSGQGCLNDMLITSSPVGLLPRYPSFSFTCAGPSSYYSHAAGLVGFVTGSCWLLPWELRFKSDRNRRTTMPSQLSSTRRVGRRVKDYSDLYAKVFIGYEFECPRGHRFLMSARDKILKASSCAQLKDNAASLVNGEMPLFFNCPCSRPEKPFVGQLMRVHTVTPKSVVRVTLNVRVQPRPPHGAIYVPTDAGGIELTASSYWTCRLPHIYVSGDELVAPPRQQVPATGAGRLLAGVFGWVIRDEEEADEAG